MSKQLLRIHYSRLLRDYEGWGLHVWGDSDEYVTWERPLPPSGVDSFGVYWDIRLRSPARFVSYILHKGNLKDLGPDQHLDLKQVGHEIWLIQGSSNQFRAPQRAIAQLKIASLAEFKNHARAYWLDRSTFYWPQAFGPEAVYTLHYHRTGGLALTPDGVAGGEGVPLQYLGSRLNQQLTRKFPHLQGPGAVLHLPDQAGDFIPQFLKGQLGVSARTDRGVMLGVTGLQIYGVLDALYTYRGPLGVSYNDGRPTLRLWAPTAQEVRLHLFADSQPHTRTEIIPLNWEARTGVWSIEGDPSWDRRYYLFEVVVFDRREGSVVRNLVTDPYSLSLSTNSTRSQIINLDDLDLRPPGWDELVKPALASPEDIVLYELHLRDFSSTDLSVPKEHRGGYLAFTHPDSNGGRHLRRLAQAGVSHVHLLPVNDFGSVDEDRSTWVQPDTVELAGLPPDSDRQQEILNRGRGRDGYNWGYDPLHYLVPEGSYASDPDGPARICEFRSMVQSLSRSGLRVVLDVVFNHTFAAGRQEKSILDQIVPDYYHRLDFEGRIAHSSCCPDTASENAMMEKLMIDSVLTWAREYKVDGFRFDLMGHHLVANMEHIQRALQALTLEGDGVDGRALYLYGEGWDFGELAGNARGPNATGWNLAGRGIGTFNDRFRDAARGGGPFEGLQEQGVITGLYLDPNETSQGSLEDQKKRLLFLKDLIRMGLAGNLADYRLMSSWGKPVSGSAFDFRGAPAAHNLLPQEHIPYLEAHDNETFFDAIQYKAPVNTRMEDRVRMQNLGISLLALSQGIPFFHAGMELLRSKSLDRDSFDSGDWFNHLDFTYQTTNWGIGLPFFDKNGANWPVMKRLLGRPALKPGPEHIQAVLRHFEEMLAIRKSTPLFRLTSTEAILENVRFHNTGPAQEPALIVMSLGVSASLAGGDKIAPVIVLFNFGPEEISFQNEKLDFQGSVLHPVLAASSDKVVRRAVYDPVTGTYSVPGRTTAVFV